MGTYHNRLDFNLSPTHTILVLLLYFVSNNTREIAVDTSPCRDQSYVRRWREQRRERKQLLAGRGDQWDGNRTAVRPLPAAKYIRLPSSSSFVIMSHPSRDPIPFPGRHAMPRLRQSLAMRSSVQIYPALPRSHIIGFRCCLARSTSKQDEP
jgi:hypothetical protein